MKKLLLATCLLSFIISCKKEAEDIKSKAPLAYVEVPKESHKELYGLWTGVLEPDYDLTENEDGYIEEETKKITIKINRISKDSIFGQSIVGGNQRSLKGIIKNKAGQLFFTLKESGSSKYDGKFELSLYNDTLQGNWAIYKPNNEITPKKTLRLVQKQFAYDPNFMLNEEWDEIVDWDQPMQQTVVDSTEDGEKNIYVRDIYRVASEEVFKINASTDTLSEESLKNLRKLDLEIVRNSIFARHGYSFKKSSLRYFFESSEWYVPVSNNVDNELTGLEKQNIALLKRMEEYATDHYDTFGR